MFEITKRFCDSLLEAGLPGFDLAVYKDGDCILRYRNGYSDLENKVPVNGTERYNIYSCSKVITCTAALQLWEQGRFSLEDKLSDYMPEFAAMTVKTEEGVRPARNPILIKHLFEMTAGFSYDVYSPSLQRCREETGGVCPTREAMKYLAQEPLLFEPGERWEYSLCHDVLAALVEVIAGEPFEKYVKAHIFDVAGMERSAFILPEEELSTVAEQYNFVDGKAQNVGKPIANLQLGSRYAAGGAGCISTADDYMKFLEALRTGKLIRPETLRQMVTDRLTEEQKRTYWYRDIYGYGLGVRCSSGDPRYPDCGWDGAACSYLALDLESGISLFFATHLLSSPVQGPRSLLYRLVKAELSDPAALDGIREDLETVHNYPFAL